MKTNFERIDPILSVTDMAVATSYYIEVLGFTKAPWSNERFGCVSRDGCSIYLASSGHGPLGAYVWVGVEDVDALYRECQASGAMVRATPANYPWARQMEVSDPDGNILRFGSDVKEALLESKP
ncbi:MAG: hypothetical protein QOD99_33 [Chthoniobacter sp.]|nr:hypothetical protein [Chthoniobacter sp.]